MLRAILFVGLLLMIPGARCLAQEQHEAAAPATGASAHDTMAHDASAHEHGGVDTQPHPVLPPKADWHGVTVIVILGSFLAAAMVGVIVRANMPPELPAPHDDSHGAGLHDAPGDAHGHGHGHGH